MYSAIYINKIFAYSLNRAYDILHVPTLLKKLLNMGIMGKTYNRISKVHLIWIPSHVNIVGNERADALAKLSLNMPDINSTNYIELPEVFSVVKSHIINE